MSNYGTPIGGTIDQNAFAAFTVDYFNTPFQGGSVSTILTEAFKALIAAGVVRLNDGASPNDVTVSVHGGRVLIMESDPDSNDPKRYWYAGDNVPSFTPVIQAAADLLQAVLETAPWTGPEHWPYTRN